jgi:putative acetyltransferase
MAMAGITLKPMSLRDFPHLMDLWRAAEGVGLGPGDDRESLGDYLRRNRGCSFVAQEAGRVVGAILAGHDGRRGYLHHLAVAPGHRRRGLGRALVEACLARLREAGIPKAHIFIFAANREGAGFWQALGWSARSDLRVMSRSL